MINRDQNLAHARRFGAFAAIGGFAGLVRRLAKARRGVVALEFAIMAVPFFMFVLFIAELSYDLFTQHVLDYALHRAVDNQLARGKTVGVANGNDFIQNYLCLAMGGLLECNGASPHIYMKVQKFAVSAGTNGVGVVNDFYDITTGKLPMVGNALDLSGFTSTSFCTAQPGTFILVSVIYVGPSLVGTLLPNVISVIGPSGGQVHATLSTTGIFTEKYSPNGGGATSC